VHPHRLHACMFACCVLITRLSHTPHTLPLHTQILAYCASLHAHILGIITCSFTCSFACCMLCILAHCIFRILAYSVNSHTHVYSASSHSAYSHTLHTLHRCMLTYRSASSHAHLGLLDHSCAACSANSHTCTQHILHTPHPRKLHTCILAFCIIAYSAHSQHTPYSA